MIPALAVMISLALDAPAPLPRPVKEPAPYTSPVGRWMMTWGIYRTTHYEIEFRPDGSCRLHLNEEGNPWINGTWTFNDQTGLLMVDEFYSGTKCGEVDYVTCSWVAFFPRNCWRGRLLYRDGVCELKRR